ncbi:MAG: hypothetical protein LBV12_03510, partial [Puniceicoccales bacterium]|jgi:hypothetical protein|nr:hypothetical protein [Puniceicoccales bacterium]
VVELSRLPATEVHILLGWCQGRRKPSLRSGKGKAFGKYHSASESFAARTYADGTPVGSICQRKNPPESRGFFMGADSGTCGKAIKPW